MHFTLFEMDFTTENCIYSFLTLEEMGGTSWYNQSHWRFCGTRRPWKEMLHSYMGRINVTQYNTLETFNLTIKYEIIAKQNVSTLYARFFVQSINILKSDTYENIIINKLQFHNYFWIIQCNSGYVITFRTIKMRCSNGYVQVYDGDGIYHSLYKLICINTTRVHTLGTKTVYFSSLINMKLSKNTRLGTLSGVILFIVFHRSELNTSVLNAGNSVTVNSNNTLLHVTYMLSNISFPKLKVDIKLFTGLTSHDCAFGGITIIVDHMTVGPLCTLSDRNAPLIGDIKEVTFDWYYRPIIIIYAYGPLFDIYMKLIVHSSSIEGIFIPLSLCTRLLKDKTMRLNRKRNSYLASCRSKVSAYKPKYFISLTILKQLIVQNFAIKNMFVSYYITINILTDIVFRILPPLVYKSSYIKVDSRLYLNVKLKENTHITYKFAQHLNYTNIYATGHMWLFHAIEYNMHDAAYQLDVTPSAQLPTSQCQQADDQKKYQRQMIGNRSMLFLAIYSTCGYEFYTKTSLYFLMFKRMDRYYHYSEKLHLKLVFSSITCNEQLNPDMTDILTVSYFNTPQISLRSYFMKHTIVKGKFTIYENFEIFVIANIMRMSTNTLLTLKQNNYVAWYTMPIHHLLRSFIRT